jgi:hypothetical protein
MKGLRTRVYLEFDRMGNLIVTPSKAFKKVWSGKTWDEDQALNEGAFLQLSQEQEPVINAIGYEARRWLKRGWGVSAHLQMGEAEGIFNCAF